MERNTNEYSELFFHCVEVLNQYNEELSEETFLEEYFQKNQISNPRFVSTVLIDCIRYSTLLQTIIDIFLKTDGINVRRSEQNIYKVIIYLILFQLDSIGLKFLRGFIYSSQLYQMHQFLQFLTNENHLSMIKIECMKFYSEEYINDRIIRVIETYLTDIRGILLDMTNQLEGRSVPRSIPEVTKLKPFNLSESKPRTVSTPKIIPKMDKARPPPKTTYQSSKDLIELERIRDENHRQALHKLHQVQSLNYHHLQTEKSTKIINPQMKSTEENLPFRANPVRSKTNKIPVKLNIATVLKESQLYKKQEDDIRRRLFDLESGGKHSDEFEQWQRTMNKQDHEREMNILERKRLEGKISYEEAILAKQRLIEENRQIANEIRQQTRQTIDEHVREKIEDEQRMKQLIEEIVAGRDNAKLAQQKLHQYKIDFVKQYKEELKQLMQQALEQAELELRQRVELIHQIRTIELQTIDRFKPFDITSTAGHGLQDEMSIAEIRERLELQKINREKQREYRRDQIIKEKQIKEKFLTNTVQNIVKYRNELSTQAVIKKQRNASAPAPLEKPNNAELKQLKSYLDSKKTERLSKQREISSIHDQSLPVTFKSSNEWNRFDQVEKSSDKAQKRLAPSLIA